MFFWPSKCSQFVEYKNGWIEENRESGALPGYPLE